MKSSVNLKINRKAIFLVLSLMVFAMSHAVTFSIDGLEYVSTSETTVEVSGYSESKTGPIEIPQTVKFDGVDYEVAGIGENAFQGCTGLTEISIPGSVTSIGNRAFYGCTGLTEISIPSSVMRIGVRAFGECSMLINLTIEDGEQRIMLGYPSFEGCPISKLYVGRDVDSSLIPFAYIKTFTEIIFGPKVTSILPFPYCTELLL